MKTSLACVLLVLCAFLSGCGSIVVATKESNLPRTSKPLAVMRYYLPRGRVSVTAKWDKIIPGWQPTYQIVSEADPDECYQLERHVNALFDDQVLLRVNPTTGLLEAAEATSADQTINIIGSIAAAVGEAFTFSAELSPVAKRGEHTEEEFEAVTNRAYKSMFQALVDPATPKQTVFVVAPETVLGQQLYARYQISLERVGPEPPADNVRASARSKFNGIVVRLAVPYKLKIEATFFRVAAPGEERFRGGSEGKSSASGPEKGEAASAGHPAGGGHFDSIDEAAEYIVLLPDEEHNYVLPLARIPLMTTTTKVALANGMIQSLDRSRPSVVGAIAAAPKTILSALLPLPIQFNQTQNVTAPQSSGSSSGSGSGSGSSSSSRK